MSYHYDRLLIDPLWDTKTNIITKDRFFEGCSKVKKCEAVFQWIVEGKIHPRQWLQFNKLDMQSMSVEIEKKNHEINHFYSLSLQWWRKLFGKFAYQYFSWLLRASLQNFAVNANWWSFNFWNYHFWLHVCVIAFAILEFIQICLVVASFLQ